MNNMIRSLYRALINLKDKGYLDEAGIVQLIELEETDWYYDEDFKGTTQASLFTTFLRKYRVAQYVIMKELDDV